MQLRRKVVLLALAIMCVIPGVAAFAAYPEKPVEVIVAFQPGGGTDVAARTIFKFAEKYFGQKFVIINKPGASGEIGWTATAKSKPDGYTIGFINPPGTLILPIQRPSAKYRLESFDLIANIVMDPGVIGVLPKSPINNLKELMAAVKKESLSVSVAYTGPGAQDALILSQLERQDGVKFNKVPFDGSAPSMVALMGGHVDVIFLNLSESYTYINDGNLKLIGIGTSTRDASVPNVPTYKEQGYDFLQLAMRGVAAPRGIPIEYRQKIEAALKKAVEDPQFKEQAKKLQMPVQFMNAGEFTKLLQSINKTLEHEWKTNPW